MKNWLARAMQMSYMPEDLLKRVHLQEIRIGHYIPNWNLQEICQLKNIKDTYHIPVDDELLRLHTERIAKELKEKNFLPKAFGPEIDSDLDWLHALDWTVVKRKHEIVWEYAGPSHRNKRGGSSLSKQLAPDDERSGE